MITRIYVEKSSICKWYLTTNYHRLNIYAVKKCSMPMRLNSRWNPHLS
nr:MAG TPA: hypothetical protein [Caudoviricetes sp.]